MEALVYDVHGNLPALEAVLDDARGDVERFVLGGDYALFGGWPKETIERLKTLPDALWIRGNGERWTASPDQAPDNPILPGAIEAAQQALGARLVADLARAAREYHPRRHADLPRLAGLRRPLVLPGARGRRAGVARGRHRHRLIFGHTHLPFRRTTQQLELINPGSVGMPFDGDPRAAYAIVHDDGSIEHRRVAYDHHASAARVREHGTEWAEVVARRIEQSRADV